MTFSEEKDLIIQAKAGCPKAKQTLLDSHEKLIWKAVHSLKALSISMSQEDLFQEGVIGFYRSIECFDLSKGYRLSTLAYHHIYSAIKRAIEKKDRIVYRPIYLSERHGKVNRAAATFYGEHGRDATTEELAELTNLPITWVQRIMDDCGGVVSITDTLLEYTGLIAEKDPSGYDVSRYENATELRVILEEAMHSLTDREKLVVRSSFWEGKNFPEIGAELNLCRQRIKQIEDEALRKLKGAISARFAVEETELASHLLGAV